MFNVTIEQQALMKALEYVEPTVGKNSANLGDNCVSMESTTNGSIIMYTTNTIEFTRVEVLATSQTQDMAPYVDFKRLKGIISTIPATEFITLTQSVNDLLITFALRQKPIRLAGCTNGMLPYPTTTGQAISLLKDFVKNVVDKSSSIIIDSPSAPLYNCIRFVTDGHDVSAEAIDVTNKRSYVCRLSNLTNNNAKQDILVEASKLKRSFKIFEDYDEIEMTMDTNTVYMRGDGTNKQIKTKGNIREVSYCARRLTGAFPSLQKYWSNRPSDYIMISKEDLLNSLTRVKSLGDESSFKNGIKVESTGGTFNVSFSSPYGDLLDPVEVNNPNSGSNSFTAYFRHDSLREITEVLGDSTYIGVGLMANSASNNYVIKGSGAMYNDEMFTLLAISPAGTP